MQYFSEERVSWTVNTLKRALPDKDSVMSTERLDVPMDIQWSIYIRRSM